MARVETAALRAIVAAALMLAVAALMLATVAASRAAGALAIGSCGAYGQAYDFPSIAAASENAMAQCQGNGCRVVATLKKGCAALAVDGVNPCGAHGWGKGPRLGRAQNDALRACYKDGGRDCVIRTFICDAKG